MFRPRLFPSLWRLYWPGTCESRIHCTLGRHIPVFYDPNSYIRIVSTLHLVLNLYIILHKQDKNIIFF